MFTKSSRILPAAGLALASASAERATGKVYGAENIRRVVTHARKYKSYGGTSCYQPHQGKREVARRLRQAERNEANRLERGGPRGLLVSRRGRVLG